MTHALWRDLSDRITSFLSNISLEELVNNQEVQEVADRQDSDKHHVRVTPQSEPIINMRA